MPESFVANFSDFRVTLPDAIGKWEPRFSKSAAGFELLTAKSSDPNYNLSIELLSNSLNGEEGCLNPDLISKLYVTKLESALAALSLASKFSQNMYFAYVHSNDVTSVTFSGTFLRCRDSSQLAKGTQTIAASSFNSSKFTIINAKLFLFRFCGTIFVLDDKRLILITTQRQSEDYFFESSAQCDLDAEFEKTCPGLKYLMKQAVKRVYVDKIS